MTDTLVKAKGILDKHFCFSQQQADEIVSKGGVLMTAEDMQFLLSLDGFKNGDVAFFPTNEFNIYDSEELFLFIEQSKKEGKQGLHLDGVFTSEDATKLKALGYYIEYTGHGSSIWDELYFTEDAYITHQISSFKNLMGSIISLAHVICE